MTTNAYSESVVICHAELVSASRCKNRCALKNEDPLDAMENCPSQIINPSLDKINTKIPKQVRDDKERDFQKPLTG